MGNNFKQGTEPTGSEVFKSNSHKDSKRENSHFKQPYNLESDRDKFMSMFYMIFYLSACSCLIVY